jgi:hypothetical protein
MRVPQQLLLPAVCKAHKPLLKLLNSLQFKLVNTDAGAATAAAVSSVLRLLYPCAGLSVASAAAHMECCFYC